MSDFTTGTATPGGLKLSVAPSVEPVTWAELKAHSRIDIDDEQTLGETYIKAARRYAERFQRRAFITQTWTLKLPRFTGEIVLPHAPLQSVTSITYLDSNGSSQTLSTDVYAVDIDSEPGRVRRKEGQSWPTTQADTMNAVTVTFVAGYGDASSDVPDTTRVAVMMLAANWFEHREPVITGTIVRGVPLHVDRLLWIDRLVALN